MSMTPIWANSAMAMRYALTTVSVAARTSFLLKPLLRPAIVKLAASRSTSYSNGPGSVSSKSLRSKQKLALRRREHAEVGEMRVAAELHA